MRRSLEIDLGLSQCSSLEESTTLLVAAMEVGPWLGSWRASLQRTRWLRGQYAKGIMHYRSVGLLRKGWRALCRWCVRAQKRRRMARPEDPGRKFYHRKLLKKFYHELCQWYHERQGVEKDWRCRHLLIKGLGRWVRYMNESQEYKQNMEIGRSTFLRKTWQSLRPGVEKVGKSRRLCQDHRELADIFHRLVGYKVGITRLRLFKTLFARSSCYCMKKDVVQQHLMNRRQATIAIAFERISDHLKAKRRNFQRLVLFHHQLAEISIVQWLSYRGKRSSHKELLITAERQLFRRRRMFTLKFLQKYAAIRQSTKEKNVDLSKYRALWLQQRTLNFWKTQNRSRHVNQEYLRVAGDYVLTSSLRRALHLWKIFLNNAQLRRDVSRGKIDAIAKKRQTLQRKHFFTTWNLWQQTLRKHRRQSNGLVQRFANIRSKVVLYSTLGVLLDSVERRYSFRKIYNQAIRYRDNCLLETHMAHLVYYYGSLSCFQYSISRQRKAMIRAKSFHVCELYNWSISRFKVHIRREEYQRRCLYHAIWFWKYWRELVSLRRWRRTAFQQKKRREDIREAYLIHQRSQSKEILRKWISSVCGPPNFQVLKRRNTSRSCNVVRDISGVVRACALYWLHQTKEHQRARIMATRSSYSLITSLPPAVSSKIPLAHLPPRRLSSELLDGIIPEELSSCQSSLPLHEKAEYSTPPNPPPSDGSPTSQRADSPIISITEIDHLVEELYRTMSSAGPNISPSERQEFLFLLSQYGELIESLKSRDPGLTSALL